MSGVRRPRASESLIDTGLRLASGAGAPQRDRQAVEAGGAAERVEVKVARHVVDARARLLSRHAKSCAVAIVPETVRQADDAREHLAG